MSRSNGDDGRSLVCHTLLWCTSLYHIQSMVYMYSSAACNCIDTLTSLTALVISDTFDTTVDKVIITPLFDAMYVVVKKRLY